MLTTVEGLIDKVQQQDKLHKTSGKASSTALMANGVRNKPNFKKKGGKNVTDKYLQGIEL